MTLSRDLRLLRFSHVWVLALAVISCGSQLLPAAEQPPERYTLFVAIRAPYESNRVLLQKMLKDEGYESFAEGDQEIVLVLTADEIEKLFQGRVRMRTVEASSRPGMITQPTLESTRIPLRFGKLIRRVYFDPQRG